MCDALRRCWIPGCTLCQKDIVERFADDSEHTETAVIGEHNSDLLNAPQRKRSICGPARADSLEEDSLQQ